MKIQLIGEIANKHNKTECVELHADNLLTLISGFCDDNNALKHELLSNTCAFVCTNNELTDFFAFEKEFISMPVLSSYDRLFIIQGVEGSAPAVPVLMVMAEAAVVAAQAAVSALASFGSFLAGLSAEAWLMIGGIALQGVSMLLSSSPNLSAPSTQAQEAATKQSFLFNGAINVTEQGGPVPLIYGKMRTGSTIISAGITTEDY